MSLDCNVIWFCHVARLVLLLSQWTCHFAVSMNLSCLYAVLMNLSCCRLDELVLLLSRWTCLVAVSMNLSCCCLDELVLLPSRWTCPVAISWLSWSYRAAVLILSCCRPLCLEKLIVLSLGCLWTCLARKALHQVPIEHVIQCLTHVIRRHDYTPSLS